MLTDELRDAALALTRQVTQRKEELLLIHATRLGKTAEELADVVELQEIGELFSEAGAIFRCVMRAERVALYPQLRARVYASSPTTLRVETLLVDDKDIGWDR
jgi:hypothetical protein